VAGAGELARLFVAVWPPDTVLDRIAAMPLPESRGVRYTRREQWHVTLRFLGTCAVDEAVAAFDHLDASACEAAVGPAVRRLGRNVLVVPVDGLDEVADAVVRATGAVGEPPESRRFTGHLTVARLVGRYSGPLVGCEIDDRFAVREARLIRSHLKPTGAVYETIATKALRVPGRSGGVAAGPQS
jgi:2'-5' RNA ligase